MTLIRRLIIVLLSSAVLSGESARNAKSTSAVHISGSVTQCGRAFPHMLVRFNGSASQVVQTSDAGLYEADLPLGVWIATTPVNPSDPPERSTSRPRHFRLTAPGTLVLNIYLRPPVMCDVSIITPSGRPATPEEMSSRDAGCWGEEFFEVPSADGVPFEVDLFGLKSEIACRNSKKQPREIATYNLLSVEADKVDYHPNERILEASGGVVIHDESGEHRKHSAIFEIRDGRVNSLH
jgi:hypothetical protein